MADARIQDHPYHPHPLIKKDTRILYKDFGSRWRCDICQRSFDGRSDESTHRYAYHCTQCKKPNYFDCCEDCFKGYAHSFHTHRLKPAQSNVCHSKTRGVWCCDACKRVFSNSNNQTNYHCDKCDVDLCTDCFKGKWRHALHQDGSHTLYPIDPRIEYRQYKSWSCEVCNKEGTHGDGLWLLYHCKQCDEDICATCFEGTKHYQHQHGLVEKEREEGRWESKNCSVCSLQIYSQYYYSCRFSSCRFYMCSKCFQAPPKPHPLHPAHPLYLSDSLTIYPDVGGAWHCDNCGRSTTNHSAKMHHCQECEFDLCDICFRTDSPKATPPLWPHPPTSAPPTSQQHKFFTSKEQYQRPFVRSATHFIPSPPTSIPAPTLCRICGLASARLTPTHKGRGHSEALYCQECAKTVLDSKETCYKCGQVPDGMIML